jgi:peptide/nickel transport system substrate-binding protein
VSNPGGNFALRGGGEKAWFGWPTDAKLELLRDAWFDAPDLQSQKAIAKQIQLRGLETLPYIPLGQMFQPTAFRSDIKDIVKAMYPLFWGVRGGRNLAVRAGAEICRKQGRLSRQSLVDQCIRAFSG